MSMNKICPVLMVSAGLMLSGCTSIKQYFSQAETGAADPEKVEAVVTEVEEAVASDIVVEVPPLVYDWDTEFSAFISPPIEVRRQAKADCVSEDYEVAVVGMLALHRNVATAYYICRGDFE